MNTGPSEDQMMFTFAMAHPMPFALMAVAFFALLGVFWWRFTS